MSSLEDNQLKRSTTAGGHPLETSQVVFPNSHRKFGSPAPLGLFAFATTTLCLSLYNLNARNITTPNVIVGLALFYGGATQWVAGLWEFAAGNTFGCTAFMTFGSFWLSYGAIYLPGTGIIAAYTLADGSLAPDFSQALAMYLWAYFVVVMVIILGSLRTSIAIVATLVLVEIVILLLAIAEMNGSVALVKAAGGLGIVTALAAFYSGAAAFYSADLTIFTLPVGDLSRKEN